MLGLLRDVISNSQHSSWRRGGSGCRLDSTSLPLYARTTLGSSPISFGLWASQDLRTSGRAQIPGKVQVLVLVRKEEKEIRLIWRVPNQRKNVTSGKDNRADWETK
ncbi:uncharacterized protein LOC110599469 isoform X2 [Ictidomys tridecemlineatus]